MTLSAKKRPKCIVMPFQEQSGSGIGLALHFLIGNVLAVHSGFAECWFGWRAGKIFASHEALHAYVRLQGEKLNRRQISTEQKVRCWIYGKMKRSAVSLELFDQQRVDEPHRSLDFSAIDGLVGFRTRFADWLGECGLPLANERREMMLWSEKATLEGLESVGRALERFYIYSAYSGKGGLEMAPFESAVSLAPESFMANNLLGWAHYRNQSFGEAKSAFLKALELNPYAVGPMAGMMWCSVLEENEPEAVRWAVEKAAKREEDVEDAAVKARKHF